MVTRMITGHPQEINITKKKDCLGPACSFFLKIPGQSEKGICIGITDQDSIFSPCQYGNVKVPVDISALARKRPPGISLKIGTDAVLNTNGEDGKGLLGGKVSGPYRCVRVAVNRSKEMQII